MVKIVINRCYGGFGLSKKAFKIVKKLGTEATDDGDIERTDPNLVKVVEELGKEANGEYADLGIVNIPDGVQWEIDYYDGRESVHEVHRSWS
jgi:hypothetical protein